jgi:hypothetical protein
MTFPTIQSCARTVPTAATTLRMRTRVFPVLHTVRELYITLRIFCCQDMNHVREIENPVRNETTDSGRSCAIVDNIYRKLAPVSFLVASNLA